MMVSQVDFETQSTHEHGLTAGKHAGRGERLIFVGGAPRSGTTLVQNMLDCHGEIYGGPEFLHIPDILRIRALLHSSISRQWINLYCSDERVDDMTAAMIEDFLLPLADSEGYRFLSEKSPMNVLVFPELIELFPKSRFIFVVRDPRAIVSSLLQVGAKAKAKKLPPPHFTKNIPAAISYTKKCMMRGFTAKARAPERVHVVVYEKLVQDPKVESQSICDFLGIPWEPGLLRPASKKHAGEKAMTVNSDELWYDAKTYYKDPEADRVDRWRTELSLPDQVAITELFQDVNEMRALEYDLSVNAYSTMARLTGKGKVFLYKLQQRLAKKRDHYLKNLQMPSV